MIILNNLSLKNAYGFFLQHYNQIRSAGNRHKEAFIGMEPAYSRRHTLLLSIQPIIIGIYFERKIRYI